MLPPIFPVLILAWMVLVLISCGAVVVHYLRHRTRRLAWSLLCPIGAVLCFGFLSVLIGLVEQGLRPTTFWLALCIGLVGVLLAVIGWREVLRTPRRPGECIACGYPIQGLKVCPECGRSP